MNTTSQEFNEIEYDISNYFIDVDDEITLEMLVDYFKQPKDEYDDKNKLWKILYHIIYELDEFGFAYNTPSEKEFIKKIQNIQ
jgi:hypothetical protein